MSHETSINEEMNPNKGFKEEIKYSEIELQSSEPGKSEYFQYKTFYHENDFRIILNNL